MLHTEGKAWERCSGRSRWSGMGKERVLDRTPFKVSKTLKWMDGGRNREAVLRDSRQERRDLEHTEMDWLGQAS